MSRTKRKKKRPPIKPGDGPDLVVLAGLPLDSFRWIRNVLSEDMSKAPARFMGVPSNRNDSAELYTADVKRRILDILATSVSGNGIDSVFTPRRILMLYVPSKDAQSLVYEFGLACFMQSMKGNHVSPSPWDDINWRHDKVAVRAIVYQALQDATDTTHALKTEISDKRMSPFSLPARNFYFPTADSVIAATYRACMEGGMALDELRGRLSTKRFTRAQLPPQAFKGSQPYDNFFEDARGRIFPPDNHGRNRYPVAVASDAEHETDAFNNSDIRRVLEQRYRFGVIVHDGNLHYDVQYAAPRKLRHEPMHCAAVGDVWVTGSHANVGVNDFIWTPRGRKDVRPTTK